MDFTANFAAINLLVVFGAAVAAMLFGALWYSPLLAGKKWRELTHTKRSQNGIENAPATFIVAFILQILAASLLSALMGPTATGAEGAQLGTILGFYIVMPALGSVNLFERRPLMLVVINLAYQIGSLGLMGFIIGQFS